MKIVEINDEEIKFNNGYILYYYHSQDCCEHVYADFEVLKSYNLSTKTGKTINIKDIDFEENLQNLIEGINEAGFNMISKIGEKFFVPCYNVQNGYYNDKLELILQINKKLEEHLNISDYIEDRIY